ncbi:MAG: TetR/AcrR family transcriptional regulator [candidate division Zixibacteria bacterium]|nr:TetR/AcrR family transcriptional regulator [Candidatus Tariuqbacter arcticus]
MNRLQSNITESRRERERLKRHNDILEAAKAVFARDGYEKTSLEEIAARCELAKGTIYYYFENKEKLLNSVVESALDEIIQNIVEAGRMENTRASIKRLFEVILTLFKRDRDIFFIFFRERRKFESGVFSLADKTIGGRFETIIRKLGDIFRLGVERGEIKDYDPLILARIFVGLFHIIVLKSNMDPGNGAELLTNILFDGVQK